MVAGPTGNATRPLPGKYILRDWPRAGLDRASATSGQLETMERTILGPGIGGVSSRDMTGIMDALKQIFGMAD